MGMPSPPSGWWPGPGCSNTPGPLHGHMLSGRHDVPFGPDCEYSSMEDCERANADRDDPAAYCAAIMHRTEGHCMDNRVIARIPFDPPLLDLPENWRPRLRMARPVSRQGRSWYRITAPQANAAEAEPEGGDQGEGEGESAPIRDGDTTIVDIYDEIGWFGT